MPKLRVHNISISIDGYGAGPDQNVDNPLGVGGEELHEWVFKTRFGRRMQGMEGGDEGIDNEFLIQGDEGIGATVMGRNMFGPIRGAWNDDSWTGWRGDNPPYHHQVFVLTHHPRSPITMQGGTTFNSSMTASKRRSSELSRQQTARTSGSAGESPPLAVSARGPCRRDACGDRAGSARRRRAPLRQPRRQHGRLQARRARQPPAAVHARFVRSEGIGPTA